MGHFVKFLLPYKDDKGHNLSSDSQANSVIEEAKKRIKAGANGVAITYSANYGQTLKIHKTYNAGNWNTHTGGANQAGVITAMENFMGTTETALQGKLQIAPITTMSYESNGYGDYTHKEVIETDLKHIKNLLDQGWDVLGWVNQDTDPEYAVGGGVAKSLDQYGKPYFPKELSDLVQETLKKYATDYITDYTTNYVEQPVASPTATDIKAPLVTLPTPKPKKVTVNGNSYELVAFYYPGHNEWWDNTYQAPFLGNFYLCKFSLTIDNITATFHNAEAAFQCTKWWKDSSIRTKFENALTGNDAFKIKKHLSNPDYSYCGLGRDGAMMAVLKEKFAIPTFKTGLLATGNAYLLEHNAVEGRDYYWSDNHDGTGHNKLGISLMLLRQQLGGVGLPSGSYKVVDFTNQV